jgi:hypothetical protein
MMISCVECSAKLADIQCNDCDNDYFCNECYQDTHVYMPNHKNTRLATKTSPPNKKRTISNNFMEQSSSNLK